MTDKTEGRHVIFQTFDEYEREVSERRRRESAEQEREHEEFDEAFGAGMDLAFHESGLPRTEPASHRAKKRRRKREQTSSS